ncbi:hypothetical protein ACJJTC_001659 [Scirpophaga incertulas]
MDGVVVCIQAKRRGEAESPGARSWDHPQSIAGRAFLVVIVMRNLDHRSFWRVGIGGGDGVRVSPLSLPARLSPFRCQLSACSRHRGQTPRRPLWADFHVFFDCFVTINSREHHVITHVFIGGKDAAEASGMLNSGIVARPAYVTGGYIAGNPRQCDQHATLPPDLDLFTREKYSVCATSD